MKKFTYIFCGNLGTKKNVIHSLHLVRMQWLDVLHACQPMRATSHSTTVIFLHGIEHTIFFLQSQSNHKQYLLREYVILDTVTVFMNDSLNHSFNRFFQKHQFILEHHYCVLANSAMFCLDLFYSAEQKQTWCPALMCLKCKLLNINGLFTELLYIRNSTLAIEIQNIGTTVFTCSLFYKCI